MKAQLSITRDDPVDVQDRVVKIWVDGERWDNLRYRQTQTRDVAPGRHVVKAHNTLFGTTIEIDAAPGEVVRLSCVNGLTGGGKLMVLMLGVAYLRVRLTRLPSAVGGGGALVRHVLGVLGIVAVTVSVAWAADRIFTNPKPDAHLKRLFPQAAAFSPLEGTPLHFKAYAADPKKTPDAQPIGYAFWTTDIMPNERGYHAAMHFLVGMDLQGILTGVVLDYDSEPYGYFSIQPPEFVAQFKGKSIRMPFRVGDDIDAVSRATITMTAAARVIRDSSRTMAKQFLNPAAVKQ